MKRQLERRQNPVVTESDEADIEPVIVHQLQERTRLQEVLCDLSRDLCPRDVVARKILAIDPLTALSSRQELSNSQTAFDSVTPIRSQAANSKSFPATS